MSNASDWRLRLSVAFLGSLALTAAYPAFAQSAGDPIPDSYICVFKPGPISAGAQARTAAAAAGGQVTRVYQRALRGFAASISEAGVARMMEKNPYIDFCEPDRIASIPDPQAAAGRPGGGGGGATQQLPWGVKRVGGPGDGAGRRAWVIDSGVDLDHPDLNVDVARSKSFLSRDASPDDANGHGTHVAGIIAAKNNTIGVVGIAAGAWVVSLRVLDRRGVGPDSGVIEAIDWAAGNAQPGDVANLSLITSASQAMDQAVVGLGALGVSVTVAAGNNAADASNYSPAGAEGAGVYTVSAFEAGDKWAFYSNYGAPVDFGEPGSSILSTYKGGGYATLSGTSMAAPHLAGILLLNEAGSPATGGTVANDPDAFDDPIGVRPTTSP